eukprot:3457757-Rhodomonas_salina.6
MRRQYRAARRARVGGYLSSIRHAADSTVGEVFEVRGLVASHTLGQYRTPPSERLGRHPKF